MPEYVVGFMTKDGVFYPRKSEARLHEAVQDIKRLCESHTPRGIQPEKFLQLLNIWSKEIREFIDANDEAKQSNTEEDTSGTGGDQADDTDGDAEFTALEQLSTSGHEPVSDVGDGSQPESVFKRGKKHGSRSRGNDA